jgi:hypothetical protein
MKDGRDEYAKEWEIKIGKGGRVREEEGAYRIRERRDELGCREREPVDDLTHIRAPYTRPHADTTVFGYS